MNDLPEGERDLAPATASVLDALIAALLVSAGAAAAGAFTAEACVRYLCGKASLEEVAAVRRAMLRDAEIRRRVRAALHRLDDLRSMPWAQARNEALAEGWDGQVAAAWIAFSTEGAANLAQARARWSGEAWGRLHEMALQGAAEATAAWEAFRAFAAASVAALPAPAPAMVRGGAMGVGGLPLRGMPQGCDVESASATVGPTGALAIGLCLRAGEGASLPTSARVELQGPADVWPLAEPPLIDGALQATIEGFGAATGLPEGPVPPGLVVVDLGVHAGQATLRVALPGGRGATEVPLEEPPRIENGMLRLALELRESLLTLYPGSRLVLRLLGAPHGQAIASWPLSELGLGWNRLSVPAPDLGSGAAAALTAEIVEGTPS